MNVLLDKMQAIDYIYESIKSLYGNKEIFVYLKENKWQLLINKEITFESRNSIDILNFLIEGKYNLNSLEIYINESLLNTAVLAKMNLRKAMKFFTNEEIKEKEKNWEKLGENIGSVIKKTLNKKTGNLTVVKNIRLVEE